MSRVDYCNAVFAGSPRYITDKLQCVLFDHGLSHLLHEEFHWLDVPERIHYKLQSQSIAVYSAMLPSTWSTAVHQSQIFPVDVIYDQPLDIT